MLFKRVSDYTMFLVQKDDGAPDRNERTTSRIVFAIEFHLLDTGHFALEEDGDVIAAHIRRFLLKANVASAQ